MITNGTMNNQTKKKKLHQIHLLHQNKPKRKKMKFKNDINSNIPFTIFKAYFLNIDYNFKNPNRNRLEYALKTVIPSLTIQ